MDESGNQRRRARQIDEEDDRATNRRRQMETNVPQNYGFALPNHEEDDDDVPLSLSLGPTPYSSSSQIPPPTTIRLAPPSPFHFPHQFMMTTASPDDFMAYQSCFMAPPPSYLASSSLYQTGSMQPTSFSFFPSSLGSDPPPPPARPRPTRPSSPAMVSRPVVDESSRRSVRSQANGNRKDDTIPPPYPWATNKRGMIQSLEYLESKQITSISGDVHCKHCEKVYQVSYDLRERFSELENIFLMRKRIMRERAPPFWTNPEPVRCEFCGRDKAVKPVIADRKSQINWLFLLLGQTLGHCTLEQLKNFCKHSKSHRTGAKDRVLYLTYLGLCKMLDPNRELFSRDSSRR